MSEEKKRDVVVHIPEPLASWIRFTAKETNRTNAGLVRLAVREMKERLDKKREPYRPTHNQRGERL